MSKITCESSNRAVLSHFYKSVEEADRWRAKGADALRFNSDEEAAIKIKQLLARGIDAERLCWCHYSQSWFVLIRKE